MLIIKTRKVASGSFMMCPIDMVLPEGSKLLLIGKNGAGKSMFLKSLVLPNREIYETYTLNGIEMNQEDVTYVGKLNFGPDIKIRTIGKEMAMRAKRFNRDIYESLLKDLAIPQEGSVKTLSLGNQQKLAIAIGLSNQPKILLIDEAFEGIDDLSKVEILKKVKNYISESKAILMLVTHKVAGLGEDFDYVIHMEDGKVIRSEDVESFKTYVNNLVQYPIAQNLENLLTIYKEYTTKRGDINDSTRRSIEDTQQFENR